MTAPYQDPIEEVATKYSHSHATSIDYTDSLDTRSFVTAPCLESQVNETPVNHPELHSPPRIINNNTFFNNSKPFNSLNKSHKHYIKPKGNKKIIIIKKLS